MANKNKTNKSVKKRIKVTGTGKLKYAKVGRRHLNANDRWCRDPAHAGSDAHLARLPSEGLTDDYA